MNEARTWEDDYDLEAVELGERVSWWITNYQLARLYSEEKDRVFFTMMVFLGCIRSCIPDTAEIPGEWIPELDENGMWAQYDAR